jgi:hypothetical protein
MFGIIWLNICARPNQTFSIIFEKLKERILIKETIRATYSVSLISVKRYRASRPKTIVRTVKYGLDFIN